MLRDGNSKIINCCRSCPIPAALVAQINMRETKGQRFEQENAQSSCARKTVINSDVKNTFNAQFFHFFLAQFARRPVSVVKLADSPSVPGRLLRKRDYRPIRAGERRRRANSSTPKRCHSLHNSKRYLWIPWGRIAVYRHPPELSGSVVRGASDTVCLRLQRRIWESHDNQAMGGRWKSPLGIEPTEC
jgi:hypothetical protein